MRLTCVCLAPAVLAAAVGANAVSSQSPLASVHLQHRDGGAVPAAPPTFVTFTRGRYRIADSGNAFEFDWPAVRFELTFLYSCSSAGPLSAVGGALTVHLQLASSSPPNEFGTHEFQVSIVSSQNGAVVFTGVLTTTGISSTPSLFAINVTAPNRPGRYAVVVEKRSEPLFGVVSLYTATVTGSGASQVCAQSRVP